MTEITERLEAVKFGSLHEATLALMPYWDALVSYLNEESSTPCISENKMKLRPTSKEDFVLLARFSYNIYIHNLNRELGRICRTFLLHSISKGIKVSRVEHEFALYAIKIHPPEDDPFVFCFFREKTCIIPNKQKLMLSSLPIFKRILDLSGYGEQVIPSRLENALGM